jgi:hypothetical protein
LGGDGVDLRGLQGETEFRGKIGMGGGAAVLVIGVAGLVDVVVDDAVEQEAIVEVFVGEEFDAGDSEGREIGAHFDDDAAFGGVDDEGVGRVERPPIGGGGGGRGREGERYYDGVNGGADSGALHGRMVA